MKLVLSPSARLELREIWRYNAKRYSMSHADAYDEFLLDGIAKLGAGHAEGRPVPGHPDLLRLVLRRGRGDGHIVVYESDAVAQIVRVLHVYHERQDIQGRLGRERPRP